MNSEIQYERKYVDVILLNRADGSKRPMYVVWEDGIKYEIDRIKHICKAASTKVGGTGLRYTIVVNGQETFIFEDDNRWFVEAKINL